jgi:hypothetical protein
MSFVKRRIDVQITLGSDTFQNGSDTITVSGLRVSALIHSFQGSRGGWGSDAAIRISGMKNADMAKLSTLGYTGNVYRGDSATPIINTVNVYAGDDATGMSLVFAGSVTSGRVNYNAQPQVGLDLVCNALTGMQFQSMAGSSYRGTMSVASMLQAICNAASPALGFVNNGVAAKLSNHAVGGSPLNQIRDICLASGIFWTIKGETGNQTLYIWPPGSNVDSTIIDVGPDTGMIGYPEYIPYGLSVSCLFNPSISMGRQINVTSSTPNPDNNAPQQVPGQLPGTGQLQIAGANGTWNVVGVTHDLASETPNGPWFTHTECSVYPFYAR